MNMSSRVIRGDGRGQKLTVSMPGQVKVLGGSHEHVMDVEKQAFDVFTNPNIDALLKALGKREIVLYGVVTEICVDRAARGLIQRGYRVNLVQDAIQHLNSELGSATIDYVRQHQGQILSTGDVLEDLPRIAAA